MEFTSNLHSKSKFLNAPTNIIFVRVILFPEVQWYLALNALMSDSTERRCDV